MNTTNRIVGIDNFVFLTRVLSQAPFVKAWWQLQSVQWLQKEAQVLNEVRKLWKKNPPYNQIKMAF